MSGTKPVAHSPHTLCHAHISIMFSSSTATLGWPANHATRELGRPLLWLVLRCRCLQLGSPSQGVAFVGGIPVLLFVATFPSCRSGIKNSCTMLASHPRTTFTTGHSKASIYLLLGTAIQHIRPVQPHATDHVPTQRTFIFSTCLVLPWTYWGSNGTTMYTSMSWAVMKPNITQPAEIEPSGLCLDPIYVFARVRGRTRLFHTWCWKWWWSWWSCQWRRRGMSLPLIMSQFCSVWSVIRLWTVAYVLFGCVRLGFRHSGRDFREIRVPLNINFYTVSLVHSGAIAWL